MSRVEGEMSSRPLSGGDLGWARWVETTSGPVVEKTYPASTPERLGGRASAVGTDAFGAALARLHDAGAPAFGWAPSEAVFIGTLPVDVGRHDDWPAFWQARTAVLLDALPGVDRRPFDALAGRLADIVPATTPARVHGDLWSGNVLWDHTGTAWLIDPAAHGGHRELDLALLALFGAPHLTRVLAAYAEMAGDRLGAGWREQLPLHQVHTLLFHAVAFGGGYLDRAVAITRHHT